MRLRSRRSEASAPNDRYAFFRRLSLFQGDEHRAFVLNGNGDRAVVLVHGFPGTPHDMRHLAEDLHANGWTVSAPLLPGFGPDLATLPERRFGEWTAVVGAAIEDLERDHHRVLLVGHSLGAAVGLLAGIDARLHGQVLLAPYWRFGGPMRSALWPLLRLWASRWKPLARANFEDQRIRVGIQRILPDVDLDDPVVQQALREFVIPTELLDELRRLGLATRKAAAKATVPTLVLQGIRDGMVSAKDSESLAAAMPGARYEAVDASHNLTSPSDGSWEQVRRRVTDFLDAPA